MRILIAFFLTLGLVACGSTPATDDAPDASGTSLAGEDAPMDTDLSGNNTPPDELPEPEIAEEDDGIIPPEPLIVGTTASGNVVIEAFEQRQLIDTPLVLAGYVPSDWVFEGSFPITLMTLEGDIIAEAPGVAEWIDEDGNPIEGEVFYTATIDFEAPASGDEGKLRLAKAMVGDDEEEVYAETIILWSD